MVKIKVTLPDLPETDGSLKGSSPVRGNSSPISAQLRKETITPGGRFLLKNDVGSQFPIKLEHFSIDRNGSLDLDAAELILELKKPLSVTRISHDVLAYIIRHNPTPPKNLQNQLKITKSDGYINDKVTDFTRLLLTGISSQRLLNFDQLQLLRWLRLFSHFCNSLLT